MEKWEGEREQDIFKKCLCFVERMGSIIFFLIERPFIDFHTKRRVLDKGLSIDSWKYIIL